MIKSIWFNEHNITWIKEASDRLGIKQNKLINTMITHLRESDNGAYFDTLCRGYGLDVQEQDQNPTQTEQTTDSKTIEAL